MFLSVRLDTDRFPSEAIGLSFDPCGEIIISDGERTISGKHVKSVWYRRNVAPNLPEDLNLGTREFCNSERHAHSLCERSGSIANASVG